MIRSSRLRGLISLCSAAAALGACSDTREPTSSPDLSPETSLVLMEMMARAVDVKALDVDLPPEPRPWDTSAVALVTALEAEDGHATIGFKPAEAERMLETGRRAAVPAKTIRQGLKEVAMAGAELLDFYPNIGVVSVRLNAAAATALYRHPLIDHIEPRMWYSVAAAPTASLSPGGARGTH